MTQWRALFASAALLAASSPALSQSGAFRVLHAFENTDGNQPASLLRASDGSLYGVTILGGAGGWGALYRIDPAGGFHTVHTFTDQPDGAVPGRLIQARDGFIYGLTGTGGSPSYGTVYRVDLNGNYSVVHRFNGSTEGISPISLIQANDGSFYGTTTDGGTPPAGCSQARGTLFRMSSEGNVTPLHTFCGEIDGSIPNSVIQAADGKFYGTCLIDGPRQGGDDRGRGTFWKADASGNTTLLHVFAGNDSPATDPTQPLGVVQAADGFFYGAANTGGAFPESGALFRADDRGNVRLLHSFTDTAIDGANPETTMVIGEDGFFYGTASRGGLPVNNANRSGVIYRADTLGNVWVLHTFTGVDGSHPQDKPALGRPGFGLFASALLGGPGSAGTVGRLDLQQATPIASLTFSPNPVVAGQETTATVTLASPAPSTGKFVRVYSQARVEAPATVFVAPGETSAQFTVRTRRSSRTQVASIMVAQGRTGVSAPLIIRGSN